jgi:hypothetical protein
MMRWVAIDLSIARDASARKANCGLPGALPRTFRGGQRAFPNLMAWPVEVPEPCDARYAAMSKRLAATTRFVCLSFGLENRSALPAMKVCLFSNPGLWTAGRHQKGPHRRCFKVSSVLAVGR